MRGIFIVGLPCAGKSIYGSIAESMGYAFAEWSSIVKKDLFDPITPRHEVHQSIGKLVAQKGVDYYPRKILETLTKCGATEHVVSGARNPHELLKFRSFYDASLVVWISSTYLIRFRRSITRNRCDADLSIKEFLASDFYELNGGLAEIAAKQVDVILFNDCDFSDFSQMVSAQILEFFTAVS